MCCHAPLPLAHAPRRSALRSPESLLRLPMPGAAPRQRAARRIWQVCCSRLPRSVEGLYISVQRTISVRDLCSSKIIRHCKLNRGPYHARQLVGAAETRAYPMCMTKVSMEVAALTFAALVNDVNLPTGLPSDWSACASQHRLDAAAGNPNRLPTKLH